MNNTVDTFKRKENEKSINGKVTSGKLIFQQDQQINIGKEDKLLQSQDNKSIKSKTTTASTTSARTEIKPTIPKVLL